MTEHLTRNGREDHIRISHLGSDEYSVLSPATWRRLVRNGALPATRVGGAVIIRRSDIEKILDEGLPADRTGAA
jgi:excisionase family DNA binding protein